MSHLACFTIPTSAITPELALSPNPHGLILLAQIEAVKIGARLSAEQETLDKTTSKAKWIKNELYRMEMDVLPLLTKLTELVDHWRKVNLRLTPDSEGELDELAAIFQASDVINQGIVYSYRKVLGSTFDLELKCAVDWFERHQQ